MDFIVLLMHSEANDETSEGPAGSVPTYFDRVTLVTISGPVPISSVPNSRCQPVNPKP